MDLNKLKYEDMPEWMRRIIDAKAKAEAKGLASFVVELKHSTLTKEDVAMKCVELAEKCGYEQHCDLTISEWKRAKRWAKYFMTHTKAEYQFAKWYDDQKLISLEEFENYSTTYERNR